MQELHEAVIRAKRELSFRAGKRCGLVITKRGTARNELARRMASNASRLRKSDFMWLEDVVRNCENGEERRAWQTLLARYEVRALCHSKKGCDSLLGVVGGARGLGVAEATWRDASQPSSNQEHQAVKYGVLCHACCHL
jgi:hypothetical protein